MARRAPKALVHPDGELFCLHGPNGYYSPIISDDDFPLMPLEEDLNLGECLVNVDSLRWVPVRIITERVTISGTSIGPYDDETGELA